MDIGWIGCGEIGTAMALHAFKAGHALAFYPRGAGVAELLQAGATPAPRDAAALAAGVDFLGVCVYDDAQVRAVLLDSGALARLRAGSVVAVHTTGSAALAVELAARAPDGVEVLDATFSGGAPNARAGSLTVMVGGTTEGLARARPVLQTYASNIFPVGPHGAGQRLKLLNNLLFAANAQLALQALELAGQLGFEPAETASLLQHCSGASAVLGLFARPPSVAEHVRSIRPYLQKDVALMQAALAEHHIAPGLLGRVANEWLEPLA